MAQMVECLPSKCEDTSSKSTLVCLYYLVSSLTFKISILFGSPLKGVERWTHRRTEDLKLGSPDSRSLQRHLMFRNFLGV
jgi:hypothetical protein